MSLDKGSHTNREFKSLQKSFGQWEAGEPSADVWENLEADLAVSAVWDRLDETLEANGSSADKALTDAYENWSPNSSGDGWSRLEEELSRERVWTRLNNTLNYPVTTRIPWVKMAAASVLFTFLAFYADRFTGSDIHHSGTAYLAVEHTSGPENTGANLPIASANGTDKTVAVDGANEVRVNNALNNTPRNTNTANKLLVSNANRVNPVNNEQETRNNELIANQNSAGNRSAENTSNTTSEETTATDLASLDQLAPKGVSEFSVPGTVSDFDFLPSQAPFRPKFSVLVGGQFSFINEKDRSAFSSSLPSMGIAGDFQYHTYLGKWRLTQDVGFSQYAQSNGSYVNGRYTNSNQKLNTVHLISSVGYSFKGVTISGGIAVNRLLNGYEESRTAITNVYNSKKLQIGATAGVDYHFTPFRNKTALGLGIQYQFVSRLKSENTVFNDIQGVKLQIKYSF
ncbi:hypothetical protein [Fluviicola sp.]|uniref:hypothetical protein n=1 Tax=Fluviicola sp. TaxID=1917219 RepID=UPI0031CF648B